MEPSDTFEIYCFGTAPHLAGASYSYTVHQQAGGIRLLPRPLWVVGVPSVRDTDGHELRDDQRSRAPSRYHLARSLLATKEVEHPNPAALTHRPAR